VFALGFLAFEFIRYAFYKKLSWTLLGDTPTNYLTLAAFIGITVLLTGAFYLAAFYYAFQFAIFDIEINWITVAICLVLADLAYYWEHRFMHRVNIAWATHTVHHSSPFFNISVAYRFGPMDSLWPVIFHLPLVLLGFNPVIAFLHGIYRVGRDVWNMKGLANRLGVLFGPPGWLPNKTKRHSAPAE